MESVGKYANFVFEKESDWVCLAIAAKGSPGLLGDAVLKLGFEELGMHRIEAKLDALNTASAALCERLGMRLEARLVDKWHYKGQWATELVYAILADEWTARS